MKFIASIAIVALLATAGSTTPSLAVDANVASQVSHFVECLDWMIHDPAQHAAHCAPSRVGYFQVTGSVGSGSPLKPKPTPKP